MNMPTASSNSLIHLVDALDDPGYYCIDVAGSGAGARIQDALQAHTCKPPDNSDQMFSLRLPDGQLYMAEYDLCLQPEDLVPGSGLFLRECSESLLQRFDHTEDGTLRIQGDGPTYYCIAVAPGEGVRINQIHKRRDLAIEECDATEPSLIAWSFSEEAPMPNS